MSTGVLVILFATIAPKISGNYPENASAVSGFVPRAGLHFSSLVSDSPAPAVPRRCAMVMRR
jgi:hypothetical protein